MYKCDHCGCIFEEPDKKRYVLCRIDGQPQYAHDHVYPDCGETEFYPVEECEECGEYFREDEFAECEEYICKTCYHGKKARAVS